MVRSCPGMKTDGKPVFIANTKKRRRNLSRCRVNEKVRKRGIFKPMPSTRVLKSLSSEQASLKTTTKCRTSGFQFQGDKGRLQDMLQLCARHDNRTEVQAKDVKVLKDMDAVLRRMHDRIDEIVKKVESEEAAKTRKD
ncbi:MAG: hypothetical protein LQ337_009011 [Flavoplaca oasis]|nr:MAG: hypothetical protein LQ337_009011 [Flavoplaca oasis]